MGGGGGGAGNVLARGLQLATTGIAGLSAEIVADTPEAKGAMGGVNPLRKAVQDTADGINTEEREMRKKAGDAAQAGRERLAAAEKEQSDAQARDAATQQAGANRRRQRAQRAASQGRAGTILTSPLGETAAASGGQKTILGG